MKLDLQFFGGRGASSGESGRYKGGGTLSWSQIKSTTSLVSERENSQEAVDEVLQVSQDFLEEYGSTAYDWLLAEIDPAAGALAYCDPDGNIAINQDYFKGGVMEAAYAQCVASGFHPSNGNKTALQAVTAHEMGHKLTADVAARMGMQSYEFDAAATRIVNEARKGTKHKGVVQMARKISTYATASNAEAIAEAVSDVYCNGKNARAESHAIVNVINGYLGR